MKCSTCDDLGQAYQVTVSAVLCPIDTDGHFSEQECEFKLHDIKRLLKMAEEKTSKLAKLYNYRVEEEEC